jgi:hypothetical protein
VSRAEAEERRARLRAEAAQAESEQSDIDFAALVDAEEEHGFGAVESLKVSSYRAGVPTMAVIKAPSRTYYRKYLDEFRNAKNDKARGVAQETLGQSCMVYPPSGDVRDRMLDAFPGLYVCAGIRAAKLGELDAEAEKKD